MTRILLFWACINPSDVPDIGRSIRKTIVQCDLLSDHSLVIQDRAKSKVMHLDSRRMCT